VKEMRVYFVLALLTVSFVVYGCGGDDGGGPKPVTGVDISAATSSVEIGHTAEITAKVTGGESKALTWSVNGIENGNEVYGTITQNSPVTYNAPDSLPASTTIVIGAVSVENETMMDTCYVRLTFTKLFVDSAMGDNTTGNGCINLPFRTITKALARAQAGMTIVVGPGTYSDAAGETFTMYVPPGVSLVGLDWEACVICKETAAFDGYNGVQLSGDDCAVRKFTFVDRADPGYSRWSSTVYTEDANSLIDSLRFFQRALMSCIRLDTSTDAVVQNCVFDVEMDPPGDAGMDRAFEIVFDDVGSIVRNCHVSGFNTALFFNRSSDARVEGCVLENNSYGVYICCLHDPTSNPNPDLGGGARGSPGGNTFRNNSVCGIINTAASTIYAKFNIWDNDPPIEGEDYRNDDSGSIIVE
jgi:hypothetical protein